jgi:hypothetical protein
VCTLSLLGTEAGGQNRLHCILRIMAVLPTDNFLSPDEENPVLDSFNDRDHAVVSKSSFFPQFVLFWDSVTAAEFQAFSRSYFDFYTLIAIYSVGFSYIGTRFSLEIAYDSNPYFKIAFAFLLLAAPTSVTFLAARILKHFEGRVCGWSFPTNILERAFWGHLEDVVAILITLTNCWYLYARVEQGPCTSHEKDSLWYSQRCNPFAEAGSLPMDQVIIVYLVPIFLQISLRGMTVQAAVACWCASLSFVIASLIRVQSWLNFWILVESLWFLAIVLEYERFMRVSFAQRQELLASIQREVRVRTCLIADS